MPSDAPSHETTLRVRYDEVDRMGVVHHSRYFAYFEAARTEFLRSLGGSYRDLEDSGTLLVVAETGARYLRPAGYDDLLTVRTRLAELGGVRLRFEYEVAREGTAVATGWTVLAATDRKGRPIRIPDAFRERIEATAERRGGPGRKGPPEGSKEGSEDGDAD
jgi:acyl-CoA thioester hydrolase